MAYARATVGDAAAVAAPAVTFRPLPAPAILPPVLRPPSQTVVIPPPQPEPVPTPSPVTPLPALDSYADVEPPAAPAADAGGSLVPSAGISAGMGAVLGLVAAAAVVGLASRRRRGH